MLQNFQIALTHSILKLKSIVIPLNQMSRSGEKHAQDYNMICSIFMALRAIYFYSIILRDPVGYMLHLVQPKTTLSLRVTVSFSFFIEGLFQF